MRINGHHKHDLAVHPCCMHVYYAVTVIRGLVVHNKSYTAVFFGRMGRNTVKRINSSILTSASTISLGPSPFPLIVREDEQCQCEYVHTRWVTTTVPLLSHHCREGPYHDWVDAKGIAKESVKQGVLHNKVGDDGRC